MWTGGALTLQALYDYFAGSRTVTVPREGYDETCGVPRCAGPVVREAVVQAVEAGTVWLTSGPTSVWRETVPYGALDDGGAVLHPPPDPIPAQALVADALPGAWRDGRTNGSAITQALSQARGRTLPWGLVREGIRAGVEGRWVEVAGGSVAVDCRYDEAGQLKLQRPAPGVVALPAPPPSPPAAGPLLETSRIQDLADLAPKLLEASAGHALRFRVSAVLDPDVGGSVPDDACAAVDALLAKVAANLKSG